jgi:RHH-type proline utilization regulon transcriptional repressor/proline dehydrogenase/delta 1-pyrroline-5-carboxylate dehydrogenase
MATSYTITSRAEWLHGLSIDELDLREADREVMRYAHSDRVGLDVSRAAAETGLYLATVPVLSIGRIELLHYVREQSLCVDYHRYGNLGARSVEQRAPIL